MEGTMIDKELIAMCDTPEIQGPWKPKVGDRVAYTLESQEHMGIVTEIGHQFPMLTVAIEDAKSPFGMYRGFIEYYRKIPRIEEVLGLLGDEQISLNNPEMWDGRNWCAERAAYGTPNGETVIARVTHESNTAIKALLKAYMHLEHNKTWDGEKWV
jgi:hypothetical protein